MNVLVNISDEIYRHAKDGSEDSNDEWNAMRAIANGTPIPDNATVGEVFCMLACKEPICETASYFTIGKDLWNAPYQKGGKE